MLKIHQNEEYKASCRLLYDRARVIPVDLLFAREQSHSTKMLNDTVMKRDRKLTTLRLNKGKVIAGSVGSEL
jgi:hypothetical protein